MKTATKPLYRRFLVVAILFATVSAMAIFSSCKFHILDDNDGRDAKPGTISVSISQSGSSPSVSSAARTVVPGTTSNASRYDIVCVNSGGATVASTTLTSLSSCSFANLEPGTITVTVNAYNDSSALIATGSTTVTLAEGGSASAVVTLTFAQTTGAAPGHGNLSLKIQWPTASADEIAWTIDGNAQTTLTGSSTPPIATDAGTGMSTVTLSATGLTSGAHAVRINFRGNGSTTGTQFEIVNVYDNMTSDRWVNADGSLADARVYTAGEVTSVAQNTSTNLTLRILSGSALQTISLTGAAASVMSPSVVTTGTVTVIPTAGVAGQSIRYSWNGATPQPDTLASADVPVTLSIASLPADTANSTASNTLTLNVTALDSGTTTAYAITIRAPVHVTTAANLTTALATATNGKLDNYVVADNPIDLSSIPAWAPVGNATTPFTGTLNGNGNTISGLTASTTTGGDAGMFGYIASPATITGVRLRNVSVIASGADSSYDGIGGLIGENDGGTITRCSVSGIVTGCRRVGGLVGNNRVGATITECYSTATVTAAWDFAGGLVGSNWGTISNCYARSVVKNVSGGYSGGLCGPLYSPGTITNCYASGTSTGTSPNGGLLASIAAGSSVTASYYDATVSGLLDIDRGIPAAAVNMKLQGTYSGWGFGSVWAIDPSKNSGYPYLMNVEPPVVTISNNMTAADLKTLINADLAGDYVLNNDIAVSGTMVPIGTSAAPFRGTFDGGGNTISGLTNTVDTSKNLGFFDTIGTAGVVKNLKLANVNLNNLGISDSSYNIGGIAAHNTGTITNCGVVSGSVKGLYGVGGLVGWNTGIIEYCYSKAIVEGNTFVGGLIGSSSGTVRYSYASGTTQGFDCVGGLVGQLSGGTVNDCYSRSSVTLVSLGRRGGGFVGSTGSTTISRCYETGLVTLTSATTSAGGFGGEMQGGTIDTSHFDTTTSGYAFEIGNKTGGSASINGHSTSDMKTQSTYLPGTGNWDFSTVWTIDLTGTINDGYPYLIHNAP